MTDVISNRAFIYRHVLGQNVVAATRVGDVDGNGLFGVLDETDESLLCHDCGWRGQHLGLHAWVAEQFPKAVMVHTPVHASWLNQVYFSIIQRKALSPNDFTGLDVVEQRLTRFEVRYNAAAKPFKWKFTTTDLADLLARLDRHQQAQPPNGAQPTAAWSPTSLQT